MNKRESDLYLRNSKFMDIVNLQKKVQKVGRVYLRKQFLKFVNQK